MMVRQTWKCLHFECTPWHKQIVATLLQKEHQSLFLLYDSNLQQQLNIPKLYLNIRWMTANAINIHRTTLFNAKIQLLVYCTVFNYSSLISRLTFYQSTYLNIPLTSVFKSKTSQNCLSFHHLYLLLVLQK